MNLNWLTKAWSLKHLQRVDFKEKTLFTFNNDEQLAKWKLHSDQEFGGTTNSKFL